MKRSDRIKKKFFNQNYAQNNSENNDSEQEEYDYEESETLTSENKSKSENKQEQKQQEHKHSEHHKSHKHNSHEQKSHDSHSGTKKAFYDKHYKKLLLIPALLLLASFIIIGITIANTGSFVHKGISLKGGITTTIVKEGVDEVSLAKALDEQFPKTEINIRTIEETGTKVGLIIESDINPDDTVLSDKFVELIKKETGATDKEISVETMGQTLGNSFFRQTMIALVVSFILMSLVIFLYFRSFVPSSAVILCAFSDMVMTIATLDLLEIKLGTAGIAALLMLIGYSVDTDIVLTMRVLKRGHDKTVAQQVKSAFRTGILMNAVTFVAVMAGLLVTQSPVLKEIMLIVAIGIVFDVINTWIQNAGLLRWYLERKGEH